MKKKRDKRVYIRQTVAKTFELDSEGVLLGKNDVECYKMPESFKNVIGKLQDSGTRFTFFRYDPVEFCEWKEPKLDMFGDVIVDSEGLQDYEYHREISKAVYTVGFAKE